MADQEQDQSQPATPHKLREAQKRGQVAKSTDMVFAAVLAAAVAACFAVGPGAARRELLIAQRVLDDAGRTDWSLSAVSHWLAQIGTAGLAVLAPFLIAVCCAAIVANVAQVGAVFTPEPISPDFNRLNPANGLKRLFSLRALYDALRGLLKLAVLCVVSWNALLALLPDLVKLSHMDPASHAAVVLGDVGPLLFKLLLALLLIALVDLIYTRHEFAQRMRMSHREILDEHKQREGDPRIRSRLRQLRNEFLKQALGVRRMPDADVLITNPTHVAVALSYRHGTTPAPQLLAKGSGVLAARMRAVARAHRIPVVENPPLARELFRRTDYDGYVPEDLYPLVARIFIWIYAMRDAERSRGMQARLAGQAA